MADIRRRDRVIPTGGVLPLALRQAVRSPGATLLTFTLLLALGLTAIFAADAKAMPQADFAVVQFEGIGGAVTQDENRLTPCPLCGRLVCPCPCDDLLGTVAPDGVALLASPASALVLGSLPLPRPHVPGAPRSTFFASFEPRGPPFAD